MNASGYVLAALFGAAATGLFNLILELFKRRQDRRGVASAIAGEIWGVLYSVKVRGLAEHFRKVIDWIDANDPKNPAKPPWAHYNKDADVAPTFKAYVDRLGQLGGALPARVSGWYTLFSALRTQLIVLATDPEYIEPAKAKVMIERALLMWDKLDADGRELVRDLLALTDEEPPSLTE